MKAYLVETFIEKFDNCGLLLGGRAVFTTKKDASRFITSQKRKYSKERYRIEFWGISTRRLSADRLAELVITEDIWNYLINRGEQLGKWEKK